MRYTFLLRCLSFATVLLCSALLQGSGTYTPGKIGPPDIDFELFKLGKNIVAGKVETEAAPEAEETQLETLSKLDAQLPKRVSEKLNVIQFAGAVNDKEFQALTYFIKQRYKLDK